MTIQDLILIVGNRLTAIKNQRAQAVAAGELQRVVDLDSEIQVTTETLAALTGLA
jgi:hypothetical protein